MRLEDWSTLQSVATTVPCKRSWSLSCWEDQWDSIAGPAGTVKKATAHAASWSRLLRARSIRSGGEQEEQSPRIQSWAPKDERTC